MMFKLKFPCGFEYEEKGVFIENYKEIDQIFDNGCPIHGKKCIRPKSN